MFFCIHLCIILGQGCTKNHEVYSCSFLLTAVVFIVIRNVVMTSREYS